MISLLGFLRENSFSFLIICMLLVIQTTSFAGLLDGSVIILPARDGRKEKHICFFGDNHPVGQREAYDRFETDMVAPAEKQHDEFLESIEESQPYRGDKELIIFLEQSPQNASTNPKDILGHLCESIQERGFTRVTVVDAEVRRVSNDARFILSEDAKISAWHRAFKDSKRRDEITFQDVLDECKQLHADITRFRKAQPIPLEETYSAVTYGHEFYGFDLDYILMSERLKKFESLLEKEVKDLSRTVYKFAEDNSENGTVNSNLAGNIRSLVRDLMNLSLAIQIIECEQEYIALVAGSFHTNLVPSLLGPFKNRINTLHPDVRHHLPKEQLVESMLSKEELLHMFIEYTFFCKVLKKLLIHS